MAVSPAHIAFVTIRDVATLTCQYSKVLVEVNRRLFEEQCCLVRRLTDLVYESVRTRLVRALLELGEKHGVQDGGVTRIEIPLSLQDLAEMVGASRSATSVELQALARRGLIRLSWPMVFLLDPVGLHRLA